MIMWHMLLQTLVPNTLAWCLLEHCRQETNVWTPPRAHVCSIGKSCISSFRPRRMQRWLRRVRWTHCRTSRLGSGLNHCVCILLSQSIPKWHWRLASHCSDNLPCPLQAPISTSPRATTRTQTGIWCSILLASVSSCFCYVLFCPPSCGQEILAFLACMTCWRRSKID